MSTSPSERKRKAERNLEATTRDFHSSALLDFTVRIWNGGSPQGDVTVRPLHAFFVFF
jgi:hypothetical protein